MSHLISQLQAGLISRRPFVLKHSLYNNEPAYGAKQIKWSRITSNHLYFSNINFRKKKENNKRPDPTFCNEQYVRDGKGFGVYVINFLYFFFSLKDRRNHLRFYPLLLYTYQIDLITRFVAIRLIFLII